MLSYCRVASPGTSALYGVEDPPGPVLEKVGDIANRVTVRQQIPTAGAVAVVVEPGAEDEVGRRAEEDAAIGLADALVSRKNYFDNTHMMTSHVKNPQ